MSTTPLTLQQFGAQVKSKYPDYANKSDEEVGRAMLVKFPQYKSRIREADTVSATPSALSPAGIKSKLLTARDWGVSQLPAAGGLIGGILGAASGAETGPGAVLSATVGAGAGGSAGEAAKQALTEKFHPEDAKMGPIETGARIVGEGALQGANELTGQVAGRTVGKILRPMAEKVGAATLAKQSAPQEAYSQWAKKGHPRKRRNISLRLQPRNKTPESRSSLSDERWMTLRAR